MLDIAQKGALWNSVICHFRPTLVFMATRKTWMSGPYVLSRLRWVIKKGDGDSISFFNDYVHPLPAEADVLVHTKREKIAQLAKNTSLAKSCIIFWVEKKDQLLKDQMSSSHYLWEEDTLKFQFHFQHFLKEKWSHMIWRKDISEM